MAPTGRLQGAGRVVIALVLAMAAGCAADRRSGRGSPTASTVPTTATAGEVASFPDPIGSAARSSAPPAAVAPTAPPGAADRLVSVPWTLVALSDGGQRITVRYQLAGCTRLSHVALAETDRRVELGVQLSDGRDPGRLCPAYVTAALSAVLLARPLGSRTLVHAPSTR